MVSSGVTKKCSIVTMTATGRTDMQTSFILDAKLLNTHTLLLYQNSYANASYHKNKRMGNVCFNT